MSEVGAVRAPVPGTLKPRLRARGTAFRDEGQGEAIVLVHGVGLNADAWQPQIAVLSRTHRVITMDMWGHGESERASYPAQLENYAEQVSDLLDALGIEAANIIGHSMGGLVAIAFALAHPSRTLRLGVLNSVYKRSKEQRRAVLARARGITSSQSVGDIEQPLERWFGPRPQQSAVSQEVRAWLAHADPAGYATAYQVFASGDEAFAGRLAALTMPALFATGSGDANSTPAMAQAMAAASLRGKALVIEDARHMMNLTHPEIVNAALVGLLQTPVAALDSKDLRKAFGTFMTGVTVVTTREANGSLRGFTANSFSSVSLDPPLLLVCISKHAASLNTFANTASFAVNILSEVQQETSGIFASKRADKFAGVSFSESATGNPLINGSAAWFDCARHSAVDAGDHLILIGRVTSYAHTDANPLGYARGGYFTLGLEQSAVNAVAHKGHTEVGAILECDGKLLTFPNPDGTLELPHVGRKGEVGSASRLLASLTSQGVQAKLGFLFAVYEHSDGQSQCIIYRGDCVTGGQAALHDFGKLPFEKFRDDATRSMLRRYCAERLEGRYKIYSGDHVSGDVRDVGEARGA